VAYLRSKAQLARLKAENETLIGASEAQDRRNLEAATKAGIIPLGCDTPDHLADKILELKQQIVQLKTENEKKQELVDALNAEIDIVQDGWAEAVKGLKTKLAELQGDVIDKECDKLDNCPTYHDGCNCVGANKYQVENIKLKQQVAELVELLQPIYDVFDSILGDNKWDEDEDTYLGGMPELNFRYLQKVHNYIATLTTQQAEKEKPDENNEHTT
jgi:uncharacterized protein YukE